MEAVESLRMSWRAIRSHKLRSTLTTLGIVIGVGAVIAFVSLGASLQASVVGQVGAEDADDVFLWAGPSGAAGGQGGPGFGAEPVFTERDRTAIREADGVNDVIPYGELDTTALVFENDTVSRSRGVIATTPAYLTDESLRAGRVFEPGQREAVLNPAAAESFETNVTVGDTVTVVSGDGERVSVTVVGVLADSGTLSAFEGFGAQPRVYLPVDPFYETRIESPTTGARERVYSLLVVEAAGVDRVETAQASVRAYLDGDSDAAQLVPPGYEYRLRTSAELLGQIRDLLDTLTGFVTGIAVISLVVASIGIANIMLVSVTERTREIGIMKAVGAQNRDVLGLFLVESVILGVIGSVLGIGLGVAGAALATTLLEFGLVLPFAWFAVAVAVGVLVGVFAGLYPAWRAARTDPIEALRYE
jgi:putative ABC transport system permease protein